MSEKRPTVFGQILLKQKSRSKLSLSRQQGLASSNASGASRYVSAAASIDAVA
jgi:hypothetical protein